MTKDSGIQDLVSSSEALLRVAVGSTNPCKIRAVQDALQTVLQRHAQNNVKLDIQGLSVPSGVRDQPMENEETKLGAQNRARAAYSEYEAKFSVKPDLAVGLEGGLETVETELWSMAWMAIYGARSDKSVYAFGAKQSCFDANDDDLVWGFGKAGAFLIPPKVSDLIVEQGMELGDADDKVFGRIKSKHGAGTVGLLTDYLIDRSHYYQHSLILALAPWIRPDAYP